MRKRQLEFDSSLIRVAQTLSIVVMWVFVITISLWIFNLLALSRELRDALQASIGISIVAIPVFLTLACVLTYVFVTLRAEERRLLRGRPDE